MKYNSKFNDAHASLAHQNLYNIVEENDKDLTKWKVMPCSYTGRSICRGENFWGSSCWWSYWQAMTNQT